MSQLMTDSMQARKQAEKDRKEKMQRALDSGQRIIIDLDFADKMTGAELRSVCKQLAYSYSANTRAAQPGHLILTSYQAGRPPSEDLRLEGTLMTSCSDSSASKHAVSGACCPCFHCLACFLRGLLKNPWSLEHHEPRTCQIYFVQHRAQRWASAFRLLYPICMARHCAVDHLACLSAESLVATGPLKTLALKQFGACLMGM